MKRREDAFAAVVVVVVGTVADVPWAVDRLIDVEYDVVAGRIWVDGL